MRRPQRTPSSDALRVSLNFIRELAKSQQFRLLAAVAAAAVMVSGCTFSANKIDLERGREKAVKGQYGEAYLHYRRVVDRSGKSPAGIKAAREAARISHYELKKYREAVELYQWVILNSDVQSERIEAQKMIADIHFNNLIDYQAAIADYNHLIEMKPTEADEINYRGAIARSYFYLHNFYQAQVEIDRVIEKTKDKQILFESLLLKANIYLTTKDLDNASSVLRRLMVENPEKARAENIGLILSVTFEEARNFNRAIEVLEEMKETYPRRAFIEAKIKALRERQSFQPGARGLKK